MARVSGSIVWVRRLRLFGVAASGRLAVLGAWCLGASCDPGESTLAGASTGMESVPLAIDDSGRVHLWADCPRVIELEFVGLGLEQPGVRQAVLAAVQGWAVPGLPVLALSVGPGRVPSEDGHTTVTFSRMQPCGDRAQGRGYGCLGGTWEGLTALYGAPSGPYSRTLEADIQINRNLLGEPARVTAVLLHELGHLYGLDHPPGALTPQESVMTDVSHEGAERPGDWDIARLQQAYGKVCGAGAR
jgi:hypothetical protein